MMTPVPTRRAKPSEEGYILVAVMFMLALLIIAMAVAMPKVAADIQRDRELETWHRGMQYRRAIQLYYRKFNRYPPSVDALVNTNQIRFLRKKYVDPVTRKDDWKPIQMGMNRAPIAMGFFGQPLAGLGGQLLGGVGLQGGNQIAGASPLVPASGSTDANGNPVDPNAGGGQNAGANPANPNDPNAGGGQNSGANPILGQAFGGAGIIGVSPASPKPSILVFKKKDHYIDWEFTYSPLSDRGMQGMQNQPPPLLPGQAPGTVNPFPQPGPGPAPPPTPTPTPQQ